MTKTATILIEVEYEDEEVTLQAMEGNLERFMSLKTIVKHCEAAEGDMKTAFGVGLDK